VPTDDSERREQGIEFGDLDAAEEDHDATGRSDEAPQPPE